MCKELTESLVNTHCSNMARTQDPQTRGNRVSPIRIKLRGIVKPSSSLRANVDVYKSQQLCLPLNSWLQPENCTTTDTSTEASYSPPVRSYYELYGLWIIVPLVQYTSSSCSLACWIPAFQSPICPSFPCHPIMFPEAVQDAAHDEKLSIQNLEEQVFCMEAKDFLDLTSEAPLFSFQILCRSGRLIGQTSPHRPVPKGWQLSFIGKIKHDFLIHI